MTAQAALQAALRDVVGPAALGAGFEGSGINWRATNPAGDRVIVNVQSSSWNGAESVRCVVNIGATPASWLDWLRQSGGSQRKTFHVTQGLYMDRIHPPGTPAGVDLWWEIGSEADALDAAREMVAQLAEHGWPRLTRLLGREGMLRSIRAGDLGHFKAAHHPGYFAMAEAALIAENGPSTRLDELLDELRPVSTTLIQYEIGVRFEEWARARAAAAG